MLRVFTIALWFAGLDTARAATPADLLAVLESEAARLRHVRARLSCAR